MLWKSSLNRPTPLLRIRTSSLLHVASENSPCCSAATSRCHRSSASPTSTRPNFSPRYSKMAGVCESSNPVAVLRRIGGAKCLGVLARIVATGVGSSICCEEDEELKAVAMGTHYSNRLCTREIVLGLIQRRAINTSEREESHPSARSVAWSSWSSSSTSWTPPPPA